MKPIVLIGHRHVCPLHGPNTVVVSGAPGADFGGRAVARVGDKTSCGATIISGAGSASIGGQAIARVGDRTDHGGTLVEGEAGILLD
ncbi:PAAR domain-containing protein [Pseudoxanthomonas putridarboris]|uniref:PAAR domain-containing protein n=1 Tax=Pseudoxanthomonas putridarboris TaxID=752605 RepID=A0ABU9J571_9GAMM